MWKQHAEAFAQPRDTTIRLFNDDADDDDGDDDNNNIIIIIKQFLYSANSRIADRCAAQEIY